MRIRVPDGGKTNAVPCGESLRKSTQVRNGRTEEERKERIGRILGLTVNLERFGKVEEVRRRKETNKDDINDKRKGKSMSVRHYRTVSKA
jgi:hypothetical protein